MSTQGGEWVPAAPPVSLDGINATIEAALIVQNDLLARVASGEVKQAQIELSNSSRALNHQSGSVVRRYQIKGTSSGGLQSMGNGELYVNSSDPKLVTTMSFALHSTSTALQSTPALTGDIVELVEFHWNANSPLAKFLPFPYYATIQVDTQDDLDVEYLGGNNVFDIDEILEVYIYPQNEETASKEYRSDGNAGRPKALWRKFY